MVLGPAFLAPAASAQREQLQAVLDAADPMQETARERATLQAEYDEIVRLWGDPFNSPKRVRAREIQTEVGTLTRQLATQRQTYDTAVATYQRAIQPQLDLARLAVQRHRAIGAASGNPEVKRRAQAAIERDLPRLLVVPLDKVGEVQSAVADALKRGRTDANIEDAIKSLTASDPVLQQYLSSMWGEVSGQIHGLPALERVAKWNKALGHLGTAATAYSVFTHETDRPFGTTEIDQLLGVIDLSTKLPTGELSFPVLSYYAEFLKLAVGSIARSAEQINYGSARNNLDALLNASSRSTAPGQVDYWTGLQPNALFGVPGAAPLIVPAKRTFLPGEPISGTWRGSSLYADDAWVGLIDIERLSRTGDALNPISDGIAPVTGREPVDVVAWASSETTNDQYDVAYVHLGGETEGTFSFSGEVPAGRYALRMFTSDSDGDLVADEAIRVGCSTTYFRTTKLRYEADESVVVEYCGMPGNDDDWVTVVASDAAADTYGEWDWVSASAGRKVFGPFEAGQYEARFYYDYDTNGYSIARRAAFEVGGAPPAAPLGYEWIAGRWSMPGRGGVIEFRVEADSTITGVIVQGSEGLDEYDYSVGDEVFRGWKLGGRDGATWSFWANGGEYLQTRVGIQWVRNGVIFIEKGERTLNVPGWTLTNYRDFER